VKLGSGRNSFSEDTSVKQFIGYSWVFRVGHSWRQLGVLAHSLLFLLINFFQEDAELVTVAS